MKVIILAGGLGTRLSEYTHLIPKPMVKICKIPILIHIINQYKKFHFKEFYIATGYKSEVITNYFSENFLEVNINNFLNKKIRSFKERDKDILINIIDTGMDTMTGGRLKQMESFISDENFMLTYGDGISDVDLLKLKKFHLDNNKIATLTAVRPPARFGALELHGDNVINFSEKDKLKEGWINGGFFVMNKKIFKYIENDNTFLEKEPMYNLVKDNQLSAYKHEGFWQCMDTKRDKDILEDYYEKGQFN